MSTNIPPSSLDELQVPEEFYKIITDFTGDILITFPEYSGIIGRWWSKSTPEETESVFRHCLKVFPERFFDILYKNVEIFQPESEINTEFLPGIVFKMLWSYDISDSTRETIWKYLQLILFAVIGSVHSTSALGETAKLFEAINEDELKSKLEETMASMSNLFDFSNKDGKEGKEESESGSNEQESSDKPEINMPNADDIHAHINEMMGGKLGKLAMELAEETAKDLNIDMENATNANDIFQKLFKNPGKMMGMVKNIGGKIDEKIKSGELKESELMSEGMDLLQKMQSMPGMDNMQKMFSQMGLGGKGGKFNMGAMEAQMNKNMNAAKMKERMKAKVNARQQASVPIPKSNTNPLNALSEEELIKIFSTGEKVEKTPRGAKPPITQVPITQVPITQVTGVETTTGVETVQKDIKVKDKKKKKK
jgi:hypothetical protein